MKRVLLSVLMLFLMSTIAFGQQEVTKFLGIPVDGSKEEMVRKLKEKGFREDPLLNDGTLIGEFNGTNVRVAVVTNNNKVWRIMLIDTNPISKTNIKMRFNILCQQFDDNKKYTPASYLQEPIPEEEDVAYEISVNDKHYEAVYYQLATEIDSMAIMKAIQPKLLRKYTTEQIANPTKEIQTDIQVAYYMYILDSRKKRPVWFSIAKFGELDEYMIVMYYDNVYNQANGEDL